MRFMKGSPELTCGGAVAVGVRISGGPRRRVGDGILVRWEVDGMLTWFWFGLAPLRIERICSFMEEELQGL